MRTSFDRRVVPETALRFVRACQRRVECHLAGGAALSGAFLAHRLSNDLDLFVHDKAAHRTLVSVLSDAAAEADGRVSLRVDAGTHVRADPGVLAWLLKEFPLDPMPMMLVPLDRSELRTYRDDIRERFKRLATQG